jgi:hypothetical protein
MATEIGRPNMAFSDVIFGGITIPMDTGLVTEDVAAAPTAAVEEETPAREDFIIFGGIVIPIDSFHGSEESAAAPAKVEESDAGYS